jgi:hypothetical protein
MIITQMGESRTSGSFLTNANVEMHCNIIENVVIT